MLKNLLLQETDLSIVKDATSLVKKVREWEIIAIIYS